MFVLSVVVTLPGSVRAETVGMEITLKAADTLTLVPCTIQALPGQTVTGTLRDCVTGGDGKPAFGPIGTTTTPGGGTMTIEANGSYTYTAPESPGADAIPFTAIDKTVDSPLPANVAVQIVPSLQVMSFTLRVTPGATITGNLNDYVTGGIGNLTFGPVGIDMRTRAGGTITIAPDGTFTYTAPPSGEVDDFDWFATDESGGDSVESLATIVIEQPGTKPVPAPTDPPAVTPDPATPAPDNGERVQTPEVTRLPSTGHGSATPRLLAEVLVTCAIVFAILGVSSTVRSRKNHS